MWSSQYILAAAVIILLAAVGLFDLWAYAAHGSAATVSAVLGKWSREFPILPLAVGVVLGHLFWPLPNLPVSIP